MKYTIFFVLMNYVRMYFIPLAKVAYCIYRPIDYRYLAIYDSGIHSIYPKQLIIFDYNP